MTHHAHDKLGGTKCRKYLCAVTLASALLLAAGGIVNSLPAFADGGGDGGGDNSAGERNFDHSGVYSGVYPVQPGGVGGGTVAVPKLRSGYYYLQGRGWVPLNNAPSRFIRGN